jgi:hypothetical protein
VAVDSLEPDQWLIALAGIDDLLKAHSVLSQTGFALDHQAQVAFSGNPRAGR